MKNRSFLLLLMPILFLLKGYAQSSHEIFPVRGFCIQAPAPGSTDAFVRFIAEELAPRKVNTLVLRVDFNYQFKSHPELQDSVALSAAQVQQLVSVCRQHQIRLIPQINLLGHQSWAGKLNNLLKVYPMFDETPHVAMPEHYTWPNADGLYCKSYCPLHPDVHRVVFDLMDEICDAFETDAFHAGMDEVFYIGHDSCSRYAGLDKAELFAGEVRTLRDHLQHKGRQLWIWGDRLLDGKTTGLGMWEASYNNTYRAVDLIPKDVMICNWHYERADQTPVYFAMKGLSVVTCPWRMPDIAREQAGDMLRFRQHSTPEMRDRFCGMMQTVWSSAEDFLDGYYRRNSPEQTQANTPWNCFVTLFDTMNEPAGQQ